MKEGQLGERAAALAAKEAASAEATRKRGAAVAAREEASSRKEAELERVKAVSPWFAAAHSFLVAFDRALKRIVGGTAFLLFPVGLPCMHDLLLCFALLLVKAASHLTSFIKCVTRHTVAERSLCRPTNPTGAG